MFIENSSYVVKLLQNAQLIYKKHHKPSSSANLTPFLYFTGGSCSAFRSTKRTCVSSDTAMGSESTFLLFVAGSVVTRAKSKGGTKLLSVRKAGFCETPGFNQH